MKKISALIALLLVAALVLSGCGKKDAAKDALSAVKERGKLIVALEGNWKPWSYHGDNDALTGYDVEVARLIASKIGVEAEIVEGEWSGLFAGVDAGRYDVVVNGVEVTDERAEKYTFSEPYGYIRTALIVRDDNEEIKTFEDLKGKSTANSIASTYMNLAESYGATCSGVENVRNRFSGGKASDTNITANVTKISPGRKIRRCANLVFFIPRYSTKNNVTKIGILIRCMRPIVILVLPEFLLNSAGNRNVNV